MRAQPPLHMVLDVFKCQVMASILALIVVAIVFLHSAFSFFLGECVMVLGNGFLTWKVYHQRKRMAPMPLLFNFLGGEVGKYVLLVALTLIIAKLVADLNWLAYAIGIVSPQFFGVIVYLIWTSYKKMKNSP